jgi:hypothetical protein
MREPFYKSISDATISLSKVVVKYINKSEKAIDFLKHLNAVHSYFDYNNNCSIDYDASKESQTKYPKTEINYNLLDTNKHELFEDSGFILIVTGLPENATDMELSSLSSEIKDIFNHKE